MTERNEQMVWNSTGIVSMISGSQLRDKTFVVGLEMLVPSLSLIPALMVPRKCLLPGGPVSSR